MPIIQPQGTAGWTYGGPGGYAKSYGRPIQSLPAQQEEDYSAEGFLNRQYQQDLEQIEQEVKIAQQSATANARYQMSTLAKKYEIEWGHIEDLRIPADKKREKLLALNAKYELAATTIRGKIQPDLDGLQLQRKQAVQQTQMNLQNKLQELSYIEKNGQEWGIDPELIEARKLQAIGISIPTAWFKQPDPMERLQELLMTTANLEIQAEKTTGEQRKNILSQIEILEQEKINIMSKLAPGFEKEIKSASKLSQAALAAGAGRKPGTLNEGMLREKRKALKINTTQFRGFAPIVKPKKKVKEEKLQPTTERIKVISPSGQMGTISTESWDEAKAAGYRRLD